MRGQGTQHRAGAEDEEAEHPRHDEEPTVCGAPPSGAYQPGSWASTLLASLAAAAISRAAPELRPAKSSSRWGWTALVHSDHRSSIGSGRPVLTASINACMWKGGAAVSR